MKMKNNFGAIAFITLALCVILPGNLFAQPLKIGYMNPQKVLVQMPEFMEVEKAIVEKMRTKDQELTDLAASIEKQFSDFEKNRNSLSPEKIASEQERLTALGEDFENKRAAVQEEIELERLNRTQPIINKVNQAMESVAKEMGLDFILNEQTATGDTIIFYAGDTKLDVTDRVLKKALEL